MRSRPSFWIVVSLLCLGGAWYFWQAGNRWSAEKNTAQKRNVIQPDSVTTRSASTAPKILTSTNAAAAKTNQFAYRLSNTKKSIGELENDPHAILLENALIDSSLPLNFSIPKKLQSPGDPGSYIVQARGPVDNAFRAMLAAAGAQIISYIPNNAFLVSASATVAAKIKSQPKTQAVIPYEPYYKVQSGLLKMVLKDQLLPPGGELKVAVSPNAADEATAALEKIGAKITGREPSPFGEVLTLQNVSDVAAVARIASVQLVEASRRRIHANDLSRAATGVSVDSVTTNNYLNLSGLNVLVAVADTGIDATHPDLVNRVFGAAGDLVDTDGHGTFVAGQIAGNGFESMTVTNAQGSILTNIVNGVPSGSPGQFRGKAPLANLFSFDFNKSDQELQEAAAQTNALISNNSWNYDDSAYDLAAASYDAAVRDALPEVSGSQPVLFVFSAGNGGNGNDNGGAGDPDTILSPATAKNVITVGAIEEQRNITNIVTDAGGNSNAVWQPQTDTSFQVAGFSSRGNVGIGTEGMFGRYKPDVVAPGTFVISTRSQEWNEQAYYNPTNFFFDEFDNQIVQTNPLNYYNLSVPANAVGVIITVVPNNSSPTPFPNLPIYVSQNNFPDPANPATYDFVTMNNRVSIPPDGGGSYLTQIQGNGFNYAVGDSTNIPVNYDLITEILTTNDVGNYFQVLSNLNNTLDGDPDSTVTPHYYRYESGTSMAAADVSGVLALMQDFFTHILHTIPSPALLKAMLINGARPTGNYNFQVQNSINDEGWGLINLPNSIPPSLTNGVSPPGGMTNSSFFIDQSPTNALATGDSQTFIVNNSTASPLRVTLAWTDPPGDPAAAIKLVNNLDLVVSNMDTGAIYFGNDIPGSGVFNSAWNMNGPPNLDVINNVENVYLPGGGTNFSVTVVGREVNVNAVTAQTNNFFGGYAPNVVQDYALVISSGDGLNPGAITVTPGTPAFASNPTGDQQITLVGVNANGMATNSSTGGVFLNQLAAANSPLLGTNTVGASNTTFATNALVTVGMTNQWHFYVVQNNTTFTNAAFVTFLPDTLATPRMGVFADSDANSTQPEADIDLYVSTDSSLTNLNPLVISNCVNGTQVGASSAGPVFNGASLGRGGTEFVVDTNSAGGQVYYVGVKSETADAAEYGFLPVFSQQPFSQMQNGNEVVNGLLLPTPIPDGSPAHPGTAYIFALAVQPIEAQDVIVSNQIVHQNFGDLTGTLNHNGTDVVLNNHDSLGGPPGPYNFIYDDGPSPMAGSQPPDGPGSLQIFQGQQGIGPWILTEVDDSLTQTGAVTGFSLVITPHQDLTNGINVVLPPHGVTNFFIDVPVGTTNLTISATNTTLPAPDTTTPFTLGELFEKFGALPTPQQPPPPTNFDKMVLLTNFPPAPPAPLGINPGNTISVGRSDTPPIQPGRYFVTIYNPSSLQQNFFIIAAFEVGKIAPVNFGSGGPVPLLDDAVTYAYITNNFTAGDTNETIAAINVGIRVDHPRISDLVFHLISPDGTRYLLMENRGGTSTNGAGLTIFSTNAIANFATGGMNNSVTNFVSVSQSSGTLPISWDFYPIPDEMTVYNNTNGNYGLANQIFDTGLVSGQGQTNLPFTTIDGGLAIIMNQFSTPTNGDQWNYTAGGVSTNFAYLTFTEDTNLTTTPIKYAVPPFVPTISTNNYSVPSAPTNVPTIAGPTLSPVNGHYYYLLQSTNWTVSEAWAEALGGHLATIRNVNEHNWIWNTFSSYGGVNRDLWIGLQDLANDTTTVATNHAANFFWVSGDTSTYRNWYPSEPNNGGGVVYEYFGFMDYFYGGQWEDGPDVAQISGKTEPQNGVAEVIPQINASSISNLYYLPEQSLAPLIGQSAYGIWQLEIQDDRAGATNNTVLDSWQLQFVFANTNPAVTILPPGTEICNITPANDILWYQVNVPLNAIAATNTLFPTGSPMNLLFNQNAPDINGAVVLLTNSAGGIYVLSTNVPPLVPGSTYYLGVQNPNSAPVDACVEVDFDVLATAYAFTEPATLVTGTNAQLNGMATPNGFPSIAWFQWGTNTLYGGNTPPVNVNAGFNVVYTINQISSLVTNVPYHFRLVVSNALGVVNGFDQILDEANVIAWGADYAGQLNVPTNLNNVVAIAGAYDHNLALKTNGTVVAWGDNTFGQANVPSGLSNVVAMAGGQYFSMALQSNGTVTAWGASILAQTNVPAGLTNVVEIAGGTYSSLALKNDGTVTAWGANFFNLTSVPAGATNIVAIAGGSYHSLALKNDGTVIVWGDDSSGQTNVPAGLTNVVAIAGGGYHSLALKNDGTVVAWGDDSAGQTNVPAGLSNVVAVAAGGFHSLALKANGTVVMWGDNSSGQINLPTGLTNVVAISGGYLDSLALTPQFLINSTSVTVLPLSPSVPQTNNILAGDITYYQVNVPTNADFATNTLLFAQNGPLNIWFSTNTPPTLGVTNATLLLGDATNGVSVLSTNGVPALVPGSTYYLGVQNTNSVTVNYAIEVDFHLVTSTNLPPATNIVSIFSIVYTNNGVTNGFLLTWFAPSNDLFQVQWNDNLGSTNWTTFTNPPAVSYNTNFFTSPTNTRFNFFDDGSQTPPGLPPFRFYRLILLQSTNPPPQTNTVPISGITSTNAGGMPGFLLTWFAPTNDLFKVQWSTNLASTNWGTFTNTVAYDFFISPTNSQFNFLDDGSQTPPGLSPFRFYRLILLLGANSLTLPVQTNFTVTVSTPVTVTNTAVDSRINAVLTYNLTNSPANAGISTNGIITWTNATPSGLAARFNTVVTDDSVPPLTATNTFTIFVAPLPSITNVTVTATNVFLQWPAPTNDLFQVRWTTNLAPVITWTLFPNIITSTNGIFLFTDTNAPLLMKFYQLMLLP